MNFKHDEDRKNAHKEVKKSKINKEALERFSRVREKNEAKRERREMSIRHLSDAK